MSKEPKKEEKCPICSTSCTVVGECKACKGDPQPVVDFICWECAGTGKKFKPVIGWDNPKAEKTGKDSLEEAKQALKDHPQNQCAFCELETIPVISPAEEAKRIVIPGVQELRSVPLEIELTNMATGDKTVIGKFICAPCLVRIQGIFQEAMQSGMYHALGITIGKRPQIYKPGAANVLEFPKKGN